MAASSESGKGDGGWWWSEVTSLASSVQRKGGSGERGIVEEEGIVGVGSWLGSYGFVFDILKAVSLLCFLSSLFSKISCHKFGTTNLLAAFAYKLLHSLSRLGISAFGDHHVPS